MNKLKEQYKLTVNYVKCPSEEELEYRTDKIISILVGNAIGIEREKLKKKGQKKPEMT